MSHCHFEFSSSNEIARFANFSKDKNSMPFLLHYVLSAHISNLHENLEMVICSSAIENDCFVLMDLSIVKSLFILVNCSIPIVNWNFFFMKNI